MSISLSPTLYLTGRPSPFSSFPPPEPAPALRTNPKTNRKKQKHQQKIDVSCNAQLLADIAPAASAAYGTLLLGGGLFAYGRSGSKGSILGGLSGAALMAAAYYLMQSPETKQVGDALGFGSAFLFSSVFGIRLAATRKFIPSGLLLAISIGALSVFISAYMQDKIPVDISTM
ncbi:protein FATTY ACID EXPORT 4, chloroplastic [Iris pallida]|uniref:Protein FATTY ACID EXPORT 4, chloroplastic n=1 Tax=Iris pallida TaxID=29817 RepID=A0AAX6G580_IRIPA|nr:protein FATTY ACID EXPORT 4, chloroplastic [Iris pallida]